MWAEAVGQIFFNIGVGLGTTTCYASFNSKTKPMILDTFTIGFANSLLCFIAGFAVFTVIGYLISVGSPVSDKVQSIGLAFVSYPAAIDLMKGANFWAALFALTIFLLGIDSAFSLLEGALAIFRDTKLRHQCPQHVMTLVSCIVGGLFSTLFCFNWGFTLFDVIDHYLCIYLLTLIGVLECLAIGWVYKAKKAVKKAGLTSVKVLAYGYWLPLIFSGPIGFVFAPSYYWHVIGVFWFFQLCL